MPSPFLASKVQISESDPVIKSVPALQTAVYVLCGVTEKGPHEATLCTSWEDYTTFFGGFTANAKDMPAAAQGYFDNGGQFLYVIRIVHYSDITVDTSYTSVKATVTLDDRDDPADETLKVDAISDGTWGNDLRIEIAAATSGVATEFNLLVKSSTGLVYEIWANLSMVDGSTRYVETILNNPATGSTYIRVTDMDSASTPPDDMPEVGTFALTTGADGLVGLVDADFLGSKAGGTGLWRLKNVTNYTLLSIPGRTASAIQNGIVTFLAAREDVFALGILDPPASTTATAMVTYVKSTIALYNVSDKVCIFWPRIKVANPSKALYGADDTITVPPCGHVAGVFARTDNLPGGVYQAGAGTVLGRITGATALELEEVKQMDKRDIVYPALINPITTIPGVPIHIDGTRTLKETSPFPSIGERRGVLFIESTVYGLCQDIRHKNNTPDLREELERTIISFLISQMDLKAFRSRDPQQAFNVDFGDGLNSVAIQRQKKLRGRVGLATTSPVDFIELDFSQDQRAAEAALAAAGF